MSNEETPEQQKIVWLASYPKSGNTWFRAFLTALLNEGEIDINQMKTDGIFSSRFIFDNSTDLDSTYLYDEEVKNMLPDVFRDMASWYQKKHLFIKIHDAYALNTENNPIVPTEPTRCAIYFIRNPLDVVASFANHNNGTLDEAIGIMNKPKGSLARQKGNFNVNNQFRQLMYSWSGHVESWTADLPFPVLVLRYEDMLHDGLATFTKAVEFMGIDVQPGQVENAIIASNFEKLKEKEKEKGFGEKNVKSESFFRKGKSGGWKDELNAEQIQSIITHHKAVMEKYGYPTVIDAES
ncbi:sulfotransferase domain-containing protein [Mucilaginibacter sp. AW1-3]